MIECLTSRDKKRERRSSELVWPGVLLIFVSLHVEDHSM